jgi:uncharacterized protein
MKRLPKRLVPNSDLSAEPVGLPEGTNLTAPSPDFVELARFLLGPLVDGADQLHLDCEVLAGGKKLCLRAAIDGSDRGRVLGRGGRNIQAIRTVLQAAALPGQTVHLEIFGVEPEAIGDRTADRAVAPAAAPTPNPNRPPVPPPKRRPKPEAPA